MFEKGAEEHVALLTCGVCICCLVLASLDVGRVVLLKSRRCMWYGNPTECLLGLTALRDNGGSPESCTALSSGSLEKVFYDRASCGVTQAH